MSRSIAEIDLTDIVFSKQKVKRSNKFLYVYSAKKPLVIKMPLMRLPFGLQKDTMSNKDQYIVDLSFEGYNDTLACFKSLDEAVIKKVQEEFYPEEDIEAVKARYVSCVKESNNPSYSPTLRTKIITDDAKNMKCDFYDNEKKDGKYPKVDVSENGGDTYILMRMGKGTSHEVIVECIGLWFFNDKFGLSFKCSQVLLHPKSQPPVKKEEECGFISDSESSNEEADFLGE